MIALETADRNLHRHRHHVTNFFIGDDRGLEVESPAERLENINIRRQILDVMKVKFPNRDLHSQDIQRKVVDLTLYPSSK